MAEFVAPHSHFESIGHNLGVPAILDLDVPR
jgi:hypothetical protein